MIRRAQGGEELIIDGKLTVAEGAELDGFPKAACVAEAAGSAPTAAEFKALLDALKAAGLMATS